MLTEVQQITLRDALRTAGLKERKIEDVLLLLRFKPERVQLVFYYRVQGMTQQWIADKLNMSDRQVRRYINKHLSDIKKYLKQ